MKKIEDFTPDELVALAYIIGFLISRKFTIIQRLVIAPAIVITVNQANLIASLDSNLRSSNNKLQKQINELKKHVKKLEDDNNS